MLISRPAWHFALEDTEREAVARLVLLALDRRLGEMNDTFVGEELLIALGYLTRNGTPSPEALDWLRRWPTPPPGGDRIRPPT